MSKILSVALLLLTLFLTSCGSDTRETSSIEIDKDTSVRVLRKNYHATAPYVWVVEVKRKMFFVETSSEVARVIDADQILVRPSSREGALLVSIVGGRVAEQKEETCSVMGACLTFKYDYRSE